MAAVRDEGSNQIGHHGLDCSHGDATIQMRVIAQFPSGILDLKKDSLGSFQEGLAGFGEHCLAAESVEEFEIGRAHV